MKLDLKILHSLVLIVAVLLRLLAVNPGFHPYHNDESTDYSGAISMILNKTLDPGRYGYPGFLPTLDAFLMIVFFVLMIFRICSSSRPIWSSFASMED